MMRKLTVSALTQELGVLLDRSFGPLLVEGEIRSLQVPASGHAYFALGDGEAVLNGVVWRDDWRAHKVRPAVGARVVVRGRLRAWAPQGRWQLYGHEMRPAGVGEAARRLAEARARLAVEGLIDPRRRRPLPAHPSWIGLVTSLSGAALHDFVRVSRERFPATRVLVAGATVQGADAVASVMRAVAMLVEDGRCDVIVVARGGGAATDLEAFNDEDLARFLALNAPVPLVTAIGHEVDETLCDAVADHAAATPSAAAVAVLPDRAAWVERVDALLLRAQGAIRRRIVRARERLRGVAARNRHPAQALAWSRRRLEASDRIRPAMERLIAARRARVEALSEQLRALGPESVLARGFAVVTGPAGVVTDADAVSAGVDLEIRVRRGSLTARVARRQSG